MGKLENILSGSQIVTLSGPFGTEVKFREQRTTRIHTNDDLGYGASALLTSEGRDLLGQIADDYVDAGSDILVTPTFRIGHRHLSLAALSDLVSSDLPRQGFELCRNGVEIYTKSLSKKCRKDYVLATSIGPSFDCYRGEKTPDGVGRDYLPQTLVAVRFSPEVDCILFETVPSLKAAVGAAYAVTEAHNTVEVGGSRDIHLTEVIGYFGPRWKEVIRNGIGEAGGFDRGSGSFRPVEQIKPYIVSFCLEKDATLNHIPLDHAVKEFLQIVKKEGYIQPAGFSINCNSPDVTFEALAPLSPDILKKFVAIYPNASSERDPRKYFQMTERQAIPTERYVPQLADISNRFGIKIIGGCCGTNHDTLKQLSSAVKTQYV